MKFKRSECPYCDGVGNYWHVIAPGNSHKVACRFCEPTSKAPLELSGPSQTTIFPQALNHLNEPPE